MLGEDVVFLFKVSTDMEPEDGRLYIYQSEDDQTVGFSAFGRVSLQDFIREYRVNHPQEPSAPTAD